MHVEYNYKYDCIVDPYTYSGTAILRNKFNIRDSSVLSKVERRITEAKLVLLQTRQLPRGHYDLRKLFKSPLLFCAPRAFIYYTGQISVQTIVQGTFEELP